MCKMTGSDFGKLPSNHLPIRLSQMCFGVLKLFQTFCHVPIEMNFNFLPSFHACKAPDFSLRVETGGWLDSPQNCDHQGAVGFLCVCTSKGYGPSCSTCLLEPLHNSILPGESELRPSLGKEGLVVPYSLTLPFPILTYPC